MLNVRFVRQLSDVIDPVATWLNAPRTGSMLMEPDHVIVPTNGVKAWLLPELAKRVGARAGHIDGVIANVHVGYVGTLSQFVSPSRHEVDDPWSIETMTAVILEVISNDPKYRDVIDHVGGDLRAARSLADRFDRYHARRPTMIRSWENGAPVFAPSTSDLSNSGEWRPIEIGDQVWQYELWREVRARIGVPSWPSVVEATVQQMRDLVDPANLPGRLMVAGLQSLSLSSIELIEAFGAVSDVEVLLVHPSPELAVGWTSEFSSAPVTKGVLPLRPIDEDLPEDIDPMVNSWLRGSREMQQMLATQGVRVDAHTASPRVEAVSLLRRLQRAIESPSQATQQTLDANDRSVQIHRCYSLSRQVEALHDAIMHAFSEIPDLAPHEVVILSPRISEAAPLLEAVFSREVTVGTKDGERKLKIPVAVADRSLREVGAGAEFLANLLELMLSRFDIDSFMAVATSPLVRDRFGIDDEDVDKWNRQIERTRVRWGLNPEQRTAAGLAPLVDSAHSWQQLIERSLLGAALPDASARQEMGGVVPLVDVGIEDIDSLAVLARIFEVICTLEESTRGGIRRPISEWRTIIENTVVAICGDEDEANFTLDALAALDPISVVRTTSGEVRQVATAVTFSDVASYLLEQISGTPGFQPLRTGAITATSLIPLRGVPFRVVCMLGVDEGVSSAREFESDDLIGSQNFVGDDDIRLELRRRVLDGMLSASERLIITCDGRSIHNNAVIPLTTVLAEFADFCRSNGVPSTADGDLTIEYFHPRHSVSVRNFQHGEVVPGMTWSHSKERLNITKQVGMESTPTKTVEPSLVKGTGEVFDLADLEEFIKSPLRMFVRRVLQINTWVEDEIPEQPIIPLTIDSDARNRYILGFIAGKAGVVDGWSEDEFRRIALLNGDLPVGSYADKKLEELEGLAVSIVEACRATSTAPTGAEDIPLAIDLGDHRTLRGSLKGMQVNGSLISVVKIDKKYKPDQLISAVRLLVALVAGHDAKYAINIHRHERISTKASTRLVYLNPKLSLDDAKDGLSELVSLYMDASREPRPEFGDTAEKIFGKGTGADHVAGKKAFDKFVSSVPGDHDRGYIGSLDYRIFGPSPTYEAIFGEGKPVLNFWRRFHGVVRLSEVEKAEASQDLGKNVVAAASYWRVG